MRLVCFDMDGVLFRSVNFWMELHKAFGTSKEGEALTKKYLHTDYERLVKEVMQLWKGKDAAPYFALVAAAEYLPGVAETFAFLDGVTTAIISASSLDLARRAQRDFGIDYIIANELVIRDGKVTGEFHWPVGAARERKAVVLRELCTRLGFPTSEAVYIGDTAADIEVFREAGASIAFNSSSAELKRVATYVVDSSTLSDIIPVLRQLR